MNNIVYVNRFPRIYRLPTIIALSRLAKAQGAAFTLLVDKSADLTVLNLSKKPINCVTFKTTRLRDVEGFRSRYPNILFSLDLIRELIRLKPQVIIQEGVGGLGVISPLFKLFFGTRIHVSFERTVFTEARSSLFKRIYQRLYFRYFVDRTIVNGSQSEHLLKNVIGYAGELRVGNVVPYLRDKNKRLKANLRSDLNRPPRIVSVMQLNDRKGADVLLQIIEKARIARPDITFLIVGSGPYLKDFADLESQNLTIIERIPQDQIAAVYERSDYLLIPTREDNFSLVVLEAMQQGCIPITTPYNGCVPDAVGAGVGYVIDVNTEHIVDLLSAIKVPTIEERQSAIDRVRRLPTHLRVARNLL